MIAASQPLPALIRAARPLVPLPIPTPGRGSNDIAIVYHPVVLRQSPGGRALLRIAAYTEFGSPRVLAVVGQRDGWLAVLTSELRNGAHAWIPATSAAVVVDPYRVKIDLARRFVTIFLDGHVTRRIAVGVGAPTSPTPPGRFAVTDKLKTTGRSPYGCCILALTGHQPNLPVGWIGGDRLAIHSGEGPQGIGDAVSAGCLHAREEDARWLIDHVPLGTIVNVH